jgi:hypothetical protein
MMSVMLVAMDKPEMVGRGRRGDVTGTAAVDRRSDGNDRLG